ncbi:PPC domain-containing protein [Oscillatoria sp. FACHB-1407]|uniref:PPC domain-containing protein n=1 Tax=Oscillatoria sp. FACHB-1407 TaxID=2692847 RepID=UPI001687DFFA|nr:PPC domain-containing protein [Oscillatoria sp. FACHB-1407]MBD2464594.1 PPC domain-containing protein [Oscillatoria sp. FACHB-1407]
MSASNADNTLAKANNLGALRANRAVRSYVGRQDVVDVYKFQLGSRGSLNIALSGLRADADLQLLNSRGREIVRSRRTGSLSESIRRVLNAGTYYVKVLRVSGNTNYLMQFTPSLEPGNQNLWGNYTGVATSTIEVSNLFGQYVGTTQTQISTTVTIGRIKQAGGANESNPFNLTITPSPGSRNVEGAIELYSAVPYNIQGGFLAQYWTFQLSGNRLSGSLTNTYASQSLDANFFNSRREVSQGFWNYWSYDVAAGTRIGGTVTANEIRLRISGNSTDGSRPFVTDIVVRRSTS